MSTDPEKWPRVTTVLKPLGDFSMVDPEVLAHAAERGTAVHLATALYDQNDLDEGSIDPEVLPYLTGWIKFRNDTGFEPYTCGVECRVESAQYQYRGTLDRAGELKGKAAILDIKTGSMIGLGAGPQTAAYLHAWNEQAPTLRALRRYVVQLTPEADYRLIPMTSPDDWPEFLNLLGHYRFLERHQ
ncbi:MAG TPA: hypothetical protein PKD75_14330 [Tepidiformaceae bacterium]|nr:hypothetical protein [Tepidiformaceae bacterium]